MAKRRRNDDGMVFSTNSSFTWDLGGDDEESYESPLTNTLYVSLERKQRAGKPVTLVEGYKGSSIGLLTLGKKLKQMCSVGGTVKEGCVLIQGDQRDKVVSKLEKDGYTVKRKGG